MAVGHSLGPARLASRSRNRQWKGKRGHKASRWLQAAATRSWATVVTSRQGKERAWPPRAAFLRRERKASDANNRPRGTKAKRKTITEKPEDAEKKRGERENAWEGGGRDRTLKSASQKMRW